MPPTAGCGLTWQATRTSTGEIRWHEQATLLPAAF